MRWTNMWRVMLIIRLSNGKAWGRLYLYIVCKVLSETWCPDKRIRALKSKRTRRQVQVSPRLWSSAVQLLYLWRNRRHKIPLTLIYPKQNPPNPSPAWNVAPINPSGRLIILIEMWCNLTKSCKSTRSRLKHIFTRISVKNQLYL